MGRCLVWKMPSNDKCIRQVRNSSISHLKMEKSDSTAVVLAKAVANLPRKVRKCSTRACCGTVSQASLKVVYMSCLSRAACSTASSL
ncbi:unnamed protein product [Sphagnum balticum]